MIPKEILTQVRRIEIKTGKLVNDVFAGQYESVFKGRGMEFSEVREYQPGDDVRNIDWNVTARFGKPFIKKYAEERELTVMLLVDLSASHSFGTSEKTKGEIAAEISALIAFSAIKNNDKVGMIVFTDAVEKFIAPKKGKRHILRMIREILYYKPKGSGTNIEAALKYLNEVYKKKSVIFLITDFLDSGYEKALRITNKRHDVIAVSINDPREKKFPNIGFIELEDTETNREMLIDTSDRKFMDALFTYKTEQEENRNKMFRSMNLDYVNINTDTSYIDPLIRLFRRRAKRFR